MRFHMFLTVLFIFERERDRQTSRGGAERERETLNPKQAPGRKPTWGSNSRTTRS